jgi:DNA-directed RNA polymerase specialized sigma subunit
MAPSKRNYVNNADLLAAMKEYLAACAEADEQDKEVPQVPRYVGNCIFEIATRLASRPNFSGYSFKEDMIMDGVENCLQYIRNFNPEKSTNAFAYFTQIIWYAFIRRIHKEKRQMYVKYKAGQNLLHAGETYEGDEMLNLNTSSDFVNAFIEDYEEKNLPKSKKSKTKKVDIDDE